MPGWPARSCILPPPQGAADAALLRSREDAWLDHYVMGVGPVPFAGVEAQTLVCPATEPSGGPVSAPNWARIAPGEVRYSSADPQTIGANAGSTAIGTTFDPVNSGGNPCRTAPAADQAGTATYRLPTTANSLTMMGAATVIAEAAKGKPIARGKAKIAGGKRGTVKLRPTKRAKRALKGKRQVKVSVVLTTAEQVGEVKAKRTLRLPRRK
ncbi:MAG: hypothetical protein FJW90_05390 [Actinobacteria bacterium]|nr:hypothetical protein [Actinomycetota bacterium]